ncbi:WXG100 family type VII secretion target [Longispora albida]|uniref:WXG100 family type VII secretion target n=1 Tax=Longispora albida TaxID=203523 RepID=UPI00036AAFEC|nr:WXG100 family type VII secretion target [Longispora albida]
MSADKNDHKNRLQEWFDTFPGFLQQPLRPIFDKLTEGLQWVAGDPDEIMKVAGKYTAIAEQVNKLATQQNTDRAKLAGAWDGESYTAFTTRMTDVESRLAKLAEATGKTKEVLDALAEACVEAANLIIDIIMMLLTWLLAEAAIALALSVISFGTSLVAGVASWIASGLRALAQVSRVVQKFSQILLKLAQVFEKIAKILKTVAEVLKVVKEILAALRSLKGFTSVQGLAFTGINAGAHYVAAQGIRGVTGGNVNIPGLGGSAINAGGDGKDIKDNIDRAQDASVAE